MLPFCIHWAQTTHLSLSEPRRDGLRLHFQLQKLFEARVPRFGIFRRRRSCLGQALFVDGLPRNPTHHRFLAPLAHDPRITSTPHKVDSPER